MSAFDAAGIEVVALSYDEPEALKDFQQAHGITYTLLSDADSEVIEAYGILNTLIDSNDHPWFGIPYPGTYITTRDGTITHKFFDNNLAVRAGPEQLLRAAKGETVALSLEQDAQVQQDLKVEVWFDGEALVPTVQKDLVVSFEVPDGRHVYAQPAPPGSVAVDLIVNESERLVQRPLVRPSSENHVLADTDESFQVHHGKFELRLPLTLSGSVVADQALQEITVSGEICWQTCDDQVCDIPAKQQFELVLSTAASPPLALGSEKGAALEPNAMAHFQRMTERRK